MSLFNCKVYLVRFALLQSQDQDNDSGGEHQRSWKPTCSSVPLPSVQQERFQVIYPSSVSIDELLKAERLVKPKPRSKAVLDIEQFNMQSRQWEFGKNVTIMIDNEKFSYGAFKDAFMGVKTSSPIQKWAIKKYNNAALKTIEETLRTVQALRHTQENKYKCIQSQMQLQENIHQRSPMNLVNASHTTTFSAQSGMVNLLQLKNFSKVHFQSTSTIMGNASIWLQTVKIMQKQSMKRHNRLCISVSRHRSEDDVA